MKYLLMGLVFYWPFAIHASYYDRKAEGWHWYENILRVDTFRGNDLKQNQEKPLKKDKKRENLPSETPKPQNDPIVRLESFKKAVERLKAVAVLNPTYTNVKAYMAIQKELMDRSTRFAQKWMEVVYRTPLLDYALQHPTSQAARHVYLDQQGKEMEAQIRVLAKTHGLFFFYSSQCVYCQQFAPIVKSFAEKYHWDVLAISLDGEVLPEFPQSRRDNGSAVALVVQSVPALLAIEPTTGKVIPLSHGMSTHDQIEDRVRVLIMKGGKL